jgi:hypothetical protein
MNPWSGIRIYFPIIINKTESHNLLFVLYNIGIEKYNVQNAFQDNHMFTSMNLNGFPLYITHWKNKIFI